MYVIGQLYTRITSYAHDPLTSTCLVLENGEEQITLVSGDLPEANAEHIQKILQRLNVPGLNKDRVVFNATHTHNSLMYSTNHIYELFFKEHLGEIAPVIPEPDNILKDDELAEFYISRIVALIEAAWGNRAPGGVSTAHDYAVVAFNRRPQFLVDGKRETRMYGTCSEPNFLGYEGGVDHSADMLYTWDCDGNLTGAAVCIPCPSQVYELHSFLSADYWGEARNSIREALGNIYILPWCGPAGDQNPLDLTRISKDNVEELKVWNSQEKAVMRNIDMLRECQDIGERIRDAVVWGYKKAKNTIETHPVFKTDVFEMSVALRTVEKADVDAAQARIDAVKASCTPGQRLTEVEMIHCFTDIGYLTRWELQQQTTRFPFKVFVFRLGHAVFATNPFELYVDFGLRMKARCKARQVFLIQLSSNASGAGYLPTQAAIDGGSYSSKPVSTMVGPDGGDELVEKTLAAMDSLFA